MINLSFEIRRIKMALPGIELDYVNSYVVKSGDEVAIIDDGMYFLDNLRLLMRELKSMNLSVNKVDKVIGTHFHVDHITLTPAINDLASPEFYIGEKDYEIIANDVEKFLSSTLSLYAQNGTPRELVERILKEHPLMRNKRIYEEMRNLDWRKLSDGSEIKVGDIRFKVLEVPGHTPGHIILEANEIAFTGDHILPKITPNIPQYPVEEKSAVTYYISSLAKTMESKVIKGYPGHGDQIDSLPLRINQLLQHHNERLNEILGLMKEDECVTAFELAQKIKWNLSKPFADMSSTNKFFAIGETISHLYNLEENGKVERKERDNTICWKLTSP